MTHDPLCPTQNPQRWDRYPWACCCDLIAAVRKDEFTKAYRKGYNDNARTKGTWEAIYGGN
jgi:hypothetical protein